MSTLELKTKFHAFIVEIEDEKQLQMYYEILSDENSDYGKLWMQLSEFQQQELITISNETTNKDLWVTNDEVFKAYKKWL
jgi:hypothetical protein